MRLFDRIDARTLELRVILDDFPEVRLPLQRFLVGDNVADDDAALALDFGELLRRERRELGVFDLRYELPREGRSDI